ncbi:MAG: trk/ktr system potassium uptake protein [Acidimicrobiaceae bacterium]|jgi:trk system potassium uptake protein TrkA|nr:trk/ktr system potassium uptake protein [Acidimicrobiaceae bacterium]
MHVIVVGCGRVGSELAVRLQRDGHSVAVLDKNARAFRRLPEEWPGLTVVGFGFDRDDLAAAGVDRAGALAAVTSGDNSNILTARIARETFQIPNVVARIYDPRRALIYQRLGIPTVATVTWTTDQVVRRLFPDKSINEYTDATGEIDFVEVTLPDGWVGKRLGGLIGGDRFRPVLVTRAGQAKMAVPELVGQVGDVLLMAVRTGSSEELESRMKGDGVGTGSDAISAASAASAASGSSGGGSGGSNPAGGGHS